MKLLLDILLVGIILAPFYLFGLFIWKLGHDPDSIRESLIGFGLCCPIAIGLVKLITVIEDITKIDPSD